MRNLILCTGWGYQVEQLKPFVESYKKYAKEHAQMIMVVEPNITEDKIKYLIDSGVIVRTFTAGYFIPSAIHNTRYFKYLDILMELANAFDRVFLTDTRDVVFQGNIFDEVKPKDDEVDLFVNREDGKHTCSEAFNKGILTNNYGEEEANKLADKPILCSGTTLGSISKIVEYIITLINQRDLKKMMEVGGIPDEQALYNYMFHHDKIKHNQLNNGIGVATLALTPSEDIVILEDGKLNVYGKEPSVIHQWDRHLNLVDLYKKEYING